MLNEQKLTTLTNFAATLSQEELIWVNGYIAGKLSATGIEATTAIATAAIASDIKLTLIYGTETGNAKALATRLAAEGKKKGLKIKLATADTYKIKDFSKEENVIIVISTQGDGEPPLSAIKFYKALHDDSLQLQHIKYGVLALGDSSYPLFCQAGIDVDTQLQLRGAERTFSLLKCDTDYEDAATPWFNEVIHGLQSNGAVAPAQPVLQKAATGKKTYTGTVNVNINLNDEGSQKATHHLEIEAEELAYEPGDAIGIVPHNSEATIEDILSFEDGILKEATVTWREQQVPVKELLKNKAQIYYLPQRVVKKYSEIVAQDIPETRMDFLDLLRIYPIPHKEALLKAVEILEPITPRLYSVSSSPEATPDEVHITVARDRFLINEEEKCGHCSDFLTRLQPGHKVDFYVHANKIFRVPPENEDAIMIGPGTGIAPFRAFLQHRDAQGASGRNWLFFGDQHFTTDFLYQTEIQAFLETGVLTKFNGAFSRDQEFKIYVQHKMLQHAEELFQWLEGGAHLYICGAKDPMSIDVEKALLEIIASQKNIDESLAINYLAELKENGKYHVDVY